MYKFIYILIHMYICISMHIYTYIGSKALIHECIWTEVENNGQCMKYDYILPSHDRSYMYGPRNFI